MKSQSFINIVRSTDRSYLITNYPIIGILTQVFNSVLAIDDSHFAIVQLIISTTVIKLSARTFGLITIFYLSGYK